MNIKQLTEIVKNKLEQNITCEKIEIQDNALDSLKIISNKENEICISYEKSKVNIEEVISLIKKTNVQIYDISTDDGDLEDVFLLLTKN